MTPSFASDPVSAGPDAGVTRAGVAGGGEGTDTCRRPAHQRWQVLR